MPENQAQNFVDELNVMSDKQTQQNHIVSTIAGLLARVYALETANAAEKIPVESIVVDENKPQTFALETNTQPAA